MELVIVQEGQVGEIRPNVLPGRETMAFVDNNGRVELHILKEGVLSSKKVKTKYVAEALSVTTSFVESANISLSGAQPTTYNNISAVVNKNTASLIPTLNFNITSLVDINEFTVTFKLDQFIKTLEDSGKVIEFFSEERKTLGMLVLVGEYSIVEQLPVTLHYFFGEDTTLKTQSETDVWIRVEGFIPDYFNNIARDGVKRMMVAASPIILKIQDV